MTAPHALDLSTELRALADALIDRVEPWLLASARQEPTADSCGWCPVCALVAAARGESTELGRRLAEQGSGVLLAVRALLAEHGDGSHAAPATPAPAEHPVRVQRIPVRRAGAVP